MLNVGDEEVMVSTKNTGAHQSYMLRDGQI
jgi:hypothetical protein